MLHYDIYYKYPGRYSPKYNVAPGQQVMAIVHDGEKNKLGELRWGLIPEWAKDEKIGYQMLNARAETLADKPAFRKPFERKRCLIPADSFYDWKGTGKHKQPMRIMLRSKGNFQYGRAVRHVDISGWHAHFYLYRHYNGSERNDGGYS